MALCTQSLIKYSLFVYANKSSWLSVINFDQYYVYNETLLEHYTLRYVDEFILKTIEIFRNELFYDEVMWYVGKCDKEIEKMEKYKVNGQLSLFELVMDCTVNNNGNSFSEIDNIPEVVHNILHSLSRQRFPIFWNLISSVFIERKYLESKLGDFFK